MQADEYKGHTLLTAIQFVRVLYSTQNILQLILNKKSGTLLRNSSKPGSFGEC